jgi:DNA adenine methylase
VTTERVALRPPFPYYGGKQLIAPRIIDLLPEHSCYVEPYAGSMSVLLAKPRVKLETVNDIDGNLMNFWDVLRTRADELEVACGLTPHSRGEHNAGKAAIREPSTDPLERARQTWVLLTQARSGKQGDTGWRYFSNPDGTSFSMPKYLESYVRRFGPAVARLFGVSLECRPALEVIADYGQHPSALLFVDPPYVRSARKSTGYFHEMDDDDHRALGSALHACRATVVLSGYASDLYDHELFPGWHRTELPAGTGNGGQWRDRTEVLWSNRPLGNAPTLFDLEESS